MWAKLHASVSIPYGLGSMNVYSESGFPMGLLVIYGPIIMNVGFIIFRHCMPNFMTRSTCSSLPA